MTKRTILATLYRKNKPEARRQYARISTAFPRAVQLLMLEGEPGDVIEFAHADFGFQIGTVKIHVGGKITVNWVLK